MESQTQTVVLVMQKNNVKKSWKQASMQMVGK